MPRIKISDTRETPESATDNIIFIVCMTVFQYNRGYLSDTCQYLKATVVTVPSGLVIQILQTSRIYFTFTWNICLEGSWLRDGQYLAVKNIVA